jgi:hypothetical protein
VLASAKSATEPTPIPAPILATVPQLALLASLAPSRMKLTLVSGVAHNVNSGFGTVRKFAEK